VGGGSGSEQNQQGRRETDRWWLRNNGKIVRQQDTTKSVVAKDQAKDNEKQIAFTGDWLFVVKLTLGSAW
jgi:hypothetical protein